MFKRKKEVFTRIDRELYEEIKKKGYTFSELIEMGYKYKEGKLVTQDTLLKTIEDLQNAISQINLALKPLKLLSRDLDELEEFVKQSRSRIASKIFPSKYETLNILSEIEKRINNIKSKISNV